MKKLTNKPSKLLTLALGDMRGLDREKYVPNSARWHLFDGIDNVCEVCLGGAVLAARLNQEFSELGDCYGDRFYALPVHVRKKLQAIDRMRVGHFKQSFLLLGHTDRESLRVALETENTLGNPPMFGKFNGWAEWENLEDYIERSIGYLSVAGY